MKNFSSLLASLALTASLVACSSSNVQQTYTANGATGYQITCGGIFGGGDVSMCYLAAGKMCGDKGYSVTHTGVSSIIIYCKMPEEASNSIELVQK